MLTYTNLKMKRVNMSPEAILRRLEIADDLRRTCLALAKAKKPDESRPDEVARKKRGEEQSLANEHDR